MKTLLSFAVAGWAGLTLPVLPARAQSPAAPPPAALMALKFPPPPPNATPAQLLAYERARWNYFLLDSTWRAARFNAQPNTLLVQTTKGLKPGTALDMGMGEGRNALYLAQQGWQVTGVDIAEKALAFGQARARQLGVPLTTVERDADTYDWGTSQWDLIVLCYAGGRTYAAKALQALRPGGLVVLEGFHRDAAKTIKLSEDVVYDTDELKKLYASTGFRIVRYEEPLAVADFSKERLHLVQLVAQKP